MLKEIGSDFWLNHSVIDNYQSDNSINMKDYSISGEDTIFLSTGRSAIQYSIKDIKRSIDKETLTAIIPSYTCESVLLPFLHEGVKIYTYDIDYDLSIKEESIISLVDRVNPDIILIHRYFGFNTDCDVDRLFHHIKNNNNSCFIIEDRTQNLFSDFSSFDADYIVGSFRKWTALPDGGFCVKTNGNFDFHVDNLSTDDELVNHKLLAFQQKFDYIVNNTGDKHEFLDSYRLAEDILDKENSFYSMSNASKLIMKMLDISQLIKNRRNNYSYVFNNINNSIVSLMTKNLDDNVVPLFLVINTPKRDALQIELRKHSIYAPIIWPKSEKLPYVSNIVNDIYENVLCLPIDQRYDIDDMDRMVNVINNFE